MKLYALMILITIVMLKENKTNEIVLGGGCFWCTEAIFKQLKGVIDVSSGYAGGDIKNPSYDQVCSGETGHAEVVKLRYDSNQISLEKILEVFFLTHDPTTINQQGADKGTQYRSVIFYTTPEQKRISQEIITQLNESKVYQNKIVTKLKPLSEFYLAEKYHQNYFEQNLYKPYCQFVIQPKMDKFKKVFEGFIKK